MSAILARSPIPSGAPVRVPADAVLPVPSLLRSSPLPCGTADAQRPGSGVAVQLSGLTRRFDGRTVLDGLDLDIAPGEFVALVGRSGCGKSTLLRLLCGLLRADSGEVRYRGQPVTRPVPGISLVFQTFALFPWLTVLENVELGLEAQGVPTAERRRRALAAIDLIGLDGFESAYPKELSGGMRQRVGFARALVVDPDVLLMDEAFSAPDLPTAETLCSDLLDLWLERRIPTQAIVMVSHGIEETLMIADRIVILDANPGRVQTEIAVPLAHPRDPGSPAFRQLTERVYAALTRSATRLPATGIAQRLPGAGAQQMIGVLDEVAWTGEGDTASTPIELATIAERLNLGIDALFPIVEALELLGFASVEAGRIALTVHGTAFLEADILRRKVIFAEHLVRHVPLAAHIRRALDQAPQRPLPEGRLLPALEAGLSPDEAERVLGVIVDWGRYAELFGYDIDSRSFSREDPADPQAGAD